MRARPAISSDPGFSLIEVVVAMLILAGVALAVGDVTLRAARLTAHARSQMLMTAMAIDRIEELRGLDWGLGDGLRSGAITDVSTDLSGAIPRSSGSGLGLSPPDTLSIDTAGYVDFANLRGEWVGTGTSPPPDAVFVRRWRISRVPDASDSLALEVLVDAIARGNASATVAGAGVVRLVAVKARKAE